MKDLTPKQREVIELVCLGKTQVEQAMILGVAVGTVKSRWREVKEKLGATKDTLAVTMYLAPDWIRKKRESG